MFMGKTTNNNNGVNVNSALYSSYSDTCMVKISAWNTNLSIKFHYCPDVKSKIPKIPASSPQHQKVCTTFVSFQPFSSK